MKLKTRFTLIIFLCAANYSLAQKPQLDFKAIDSWPVMSKEVKLANNGSYMAYTIYNQPEGSQTTYIRTITGSKWQEAIPGIGANALRFSPDSKYADYNLPNDSICMEALGTKKKQFFACVSGFEFLSSGKIAYLTKKPAALIIRNADGSEMKNFSGVRAYTLNPKNDSQLLLQSGHESIEIISLLNISTMQKKVIWKGSNLTSVVFSNDGNALTFVSTGNDARDNQVWFYRSNMDTAQLVVSKNSIGFMANLFVTGLIGFNANGDKLFFSLAKKQDVVKSAIKTGVPDVWNYANELLLPTQEFNRAVSSDASLIGEVNLEDTKDESRKIAITKDNALVPDGATFDDYTCKYLLFQVGSNIASEARIRSNDTSLQLFRLDLDDGSETPVHLPIAYDWNQIDFDFHLSPTGRWLLFFNRKEGAWYSYDLENDRVQNLTSGINGSFYNQKRFVYPGPEYREAVGIGGWMFGDKAVLIYSGNDIWKIDPAGKNAPVNLTRGYGLKHGLNFRIAETMDGSQGISNLDASTSLLLEAFKPSTKNSGFFKLKMNSGKNPELLVMGANIYFDPSTEQGYSFTPVKAKNTATWIIGRCSAIDAPTLYATSDFKHLRPLTDLQPQEKYNWLTSDLVTWTTTNGTKSQGILYKPEDFDPTKRYPVIFEFYQHMSDALNKYLTPDYAHGDINVAYFVSHGYLVFQPDIYYTVGAKGESVVNSVISAADYLSRTLPYIDSTKMGINGSSFGGWEVNYLITHTHKFAAANEGFGMCDLVTDYDNIINNHDEKYFYLSDFGYYGMGANLWQRPDIYINNSPVLTADKVTTPLLILHNKEDDAVSFSQGIELFTALWELHKPAWLLQYDEGHHGVAGPSAIDYTIRQMQFFDHYLKGAPAPKWMTEGIPPWMKGIDDGLELEPGKTP